MRSERSNGNEGVGEGDDAPSNTDLQHRWSALLDQLETANRLTRPDVRQAMQAHPRWRFLDESTPQARQASLKDAPVALGDNQTISAPHMVAILLEAAQPEPGDRCLEIGAGSGWLSILLGDIVQPSGSVIGVEIVPRLVDLAKRNVQQEGQDNVTILAGDGSLGHPEGGPYDVVIASCGAPSIPTPLTDQLAPSGRLVIPVGSRGHQRLKRVTRSRDGASLEEEDLGGCAFVPLLGEHGF